MFFFAFLNRSVLGSSFLSNNLQLRTYLFKANNSFTTMTSFGWKHVSSTLPLFNKRIMALKYKRLKNILMISEWHSTNAWMHVLTIKTGLSLYHIPWHHAHERCIKRKIYGVYPFSFKHLCIAAGRFKSLYYIVLPIGLHNWF